MHGRSGERAFTREFNEQFPRAELRNESGICGLVDRLMKEYAKNDGKMNARHPPTLFDDSRNKKGAAGKLIKTTAAALGLGDATHTGMGIQQSIESDTGYMMQPYGEVPQMGSSYTYGPDLDAGLRPQIGRKSVPVSPYRINKRRSAQRTTRPINTGSHDYEEEVQQEEEDVQQEAENAEYIFEDMDVEHDEY